MGSGKRVFPTRRTLFREERASVHEIPFMLPSRHFDGPVGMVLISLCFVANGCAASAAFCLTQADAYLFEEGSARFYPLMEGGVIFWIPVPENPQVFVDVAPGEAILVAHSVH